MAAESKTVIYAALTGNTVIAVTKFIAAVVSGSSAMLAEGIHSVVDTGNQVLMLLGLNRARQPADERFPFGHGKEVYFWSFVVALSIFAVGSGISLYEGVLHLLHPAHLGDPTMSYIVLGVAMAAEGGSWFFAWKGFRAAKGGSGYLRAVREGKDPTLFVVLFEDSAALLGLLVAFTGVAAAHATGNAVYDALATLCIGLILGVVALWLALETKGLLIGEAARPEVRAGIRELAEEADGVEGINELATLHMGPEQVVVTLSLDFRNHLEASAVEETVGRLNRAIKERYPEVSRVFVEVESRAVHLAQDRSARGA
ncbi:MAG TPA: cation diffusion facilitator family transporter [Gammaproteobacteria bacterium]|nr:cation diffusion facilitator family transporter [Gammaproteobacteria bacterium]